jgi:hypothetical protein
VRAVAAVTTIGMLMGRALAADPPPVVMTDPARPGAELLGFSGNLQVLRVSLWFWQHGTAARPCMVLHLRATGTIPTVHVMTTGLGRAMLAIASDPTHACDRHLSLDWREQIQLNYYGATGVQDWALAVLPDPTALEADGITMDGQIIALAPGAGTVAVPLKVERLPLSAIMSAVLWTLGVVLPAGLTYVLARTADRWNERRKVALDRQAARTAQIEAFADWLGKPPPDRARPATDNRFGL